MNPGDTPSPAGAGRPTPPGALNEGRGVNPGDTPRDKLRTLVAKLSALNEGRGVNPGDTLRVLLGGVLPDDRSTKAGA